MEESPESQKLDYIINIDNGDLVRKLAAGIDGNDLGEKTKRFNQLKELCQHSPEGHAKVIQIAEQLRDIKKSRYCFGWLLHELNKAGSTSFRRCLLSLVNSIIDLTEHLEDRRKIRNELIGLRILDVLKDIKKEQNQNAETLNEVTVFEQSREKDDEHLTGINDVDLNSHLDVFYAILKQVLATPQEVQYLSVLQHLLQIDTTDVISDVIWENVDRFITKAALLDRKSDFEKLQLEGKRRLERNLQTRANCERNCQCSCHGEGMEMNQDETLSPSCRRRLESLKGNEQLPTFLPPPPPPPPPPAMLPPAPKFPGIRQLPNTPGTIPIPPPPPPASCQFKPDTLLSSNPGDCTDSSGGSEACGVRLSQQLTPVPKSRMKKLQWSKIPASKVVGKTNVWTAVGKTFSNYSLNFSELEELFGICEVVRTAAATESKDGDKKKKSDEINLLDSKRSLNVNIFLKQFRISHADIISCLTAGQGSLITPEKLRGLQKILPEHDDIEVLKTFDGDSTKLGNAEKFYLELMKLPDYKLRTEALLIREEFVQTVDLIKTSIDSLILTAKDIKESKSVQEIIFLVLKAGNFLNSGGYGGDAAGFKLASLLKLTETNSNKPGMTLLHYVVAAAAQKNPKLLKLSDELKYLKEAAQYSVEALTSDIVSLRGKLKSISEQLEKVDESFRKPMEAFVQEANKEMKGLEMDLEELETLRKHLAEYFCEEEKTFKLDECIKTFGAFVDRFQKAVQDNEQKEKSLQRKRQQEKSHLRTLSTDTTSLTSASLSTSPGGPRLSDGGFRRCLTPVDNRSGRLSSSQELSSIGDQRAVTPTGEVKFRNHKVSPEEGTRPHSLEDAMIGGKDAEKRTRQSAELHSDDLFDYLRQSEDGGLGEFERTASIRRSRRRPRTPLGGAVIADRERSLAQQPTAPSMKEAPQNLAPPGAFSDTTSVQNRIRSWRTSVEKTSPLLETDLLRPDASSSRPLLESKSVGTRRSVSHDGSEVSDNDRSRNGEAVRFGDRKNGIISAVSSGEPGLEKERKSSTDKILDLCSEISAEFPKCISQSDLSAASRKKNPVVFINEVASDNTTAEVNIDDLINDLEQTGRDIERKLSLNQKENRSHHSARKERGEGDGAPQKLMGRNQSEVPAQKTPTFDEITSSSSSSTSSALQSTSEARNQLTTVAKTFRDAENNSPSSATTVDDIDLKLKRWGRVFEEERGRSDSSTTKNQTIQLSGQGDRCDENLTSGANDGIESVAILEEPGLSKSGRHMRSTKFEVNTDGVNLRQRNSSSSSAQFQANRSMSAAEDEGYSTMSNRSSSQTASIASIEERLESEKMSQIWNLNTDGETKLSESRGESPAVGKIDSDSAVSSAYGSSPSGTETKGDEMTEEADEPKTGTSLFARSIDSLVIKGELVPTGTAINIDSNDQTPTEASTGVPCLGGETEAEAMDSGSEYYAEATRNKRLSLSREVRVHPEKSVPLARTSTSSPKVQKPSISNVTERLSKPKKQSTVTTNKSSSTAPAAAVAKNTNRQESFVRGSTSRATMPASVFNANKKKASEQNEIVPVPPQRTTSIRASAASDRLVKGLPTSQPRRSADLSHTSAVSMPAPKKSSVLAGQSVPDGCAEDGGSTKNNKSQFSLKKIIQKNPIRKSPLVTPSKEDVPGIHRPSKPGMTSMRISRV